MKWDSDEGNVMRTQKEKDTADLYQLYVRKAFDTAVMTTYSSLRKCCFNTIPYLLDGY